VLDHRQPATQCAAPAGVLGLHRSQAPGAMVGARRFHDDGAQLLVSTRRCVALRDAWSGRTRLPEPYYVRRNHTARTPRLPSWWRHGCRAGAIHPDLDVLCSRTLPHATYMARTIPISGRARPCNQNLQRRQRSVADHGTARRLRRDDGIREDHIDVRAITTAHARLRAGRLRRRPVVRFAHAYLSRSDTPVSGARDRLASEQDAGYGGLPYRPKPSEAVAVREA